MTFADLDMDTWNSLNDSRAAALAAEIATAYDLRLDELYERQWCGRSHRVATFVRDGTRFALVPGAEAALGYDGVRWRPTVAQRAEYADAVADFGLPAMDVFIDAMTSPPRRAGLAALLVSVDAVDLAASRLPRDDPRVLELASGHSRPRAVATGGGIRVRFDEAGRVATAEEILSTTHDEIAGLLEPNGMRAATPDEWEYACGAGASTLFRWGDDAPGDRYPVDADGVHTEPNLFGLHIGQDPYRDERTADPAVICGGDGGGMVCGGMGFVLGWLSLATSFRDSGHAEFMNDNPGLGAFWVRPVIDLDLSQMRDERT